MSKQIRISLLEFINPSRNYLILVTALIAAVCLASALAFASAAGSLDPVQRWLFLLFLLAFPVGGLTLSLWLILRNSRKLAASAKDGGIAWRIMSAERQQRKLNAEVGRIAQLLAIPQDQTDELRSAYLVAEDLALRHIEKESQIPLMRHIALDGAEFDAILIDHEIIKCVEMTFLVAPDVSEGKIAAILKKVEAAKNTFAAIRPHTKLILLLALVTQLDQAGEAELRSTVAAKFAHTPVDVDIRLFDFEELQRVFTAE